MHTQKSRALIAAASRRRWQNPATRQAMMEGKSDPSVIERRKQALALHWTPERRAEWQRMALKFHAERRRMRYMASEPLAAKA